MSVRSRLRSSGPGRMFPLTTRWPYKWHIQLSPCRVPYRYSVSWLSLSQWVDMTALRTSGIHSSGLPSVHSWEGQQINTPDQKGVFLQSPHLLQQVSQQVGGKQVHSRPALPLPDELRQMVPTRIALQPFPSTSRICTMLHLRLSWEGDWSIFRKCD